MKFNNQSGEGRKGFIFSMAIMGSMIFAGAKYIPVKIDAYNFRDTIREECRMAAVRNSDSVVAERIMDEAKDLQIPLKRKNLTIKRTKRRMIITAHYEQPIDFKVTKWTFRFKAHEEAPLF
jgi:hypothetical protein